MPDNGQGDILKSELVGLFQYIQRVKQEIAAINKPADSEHHFDSMSDQLAAIVKATEQATDSIMETVETNDRIIDEIRPLIEGNEAATALLNKMANNSQDIFQACSFQDITGQRVNKITTSLGYVEERVNSIVSIWGEHALDDVEIEEEEKSEDEKLLNGPQLEGKGLSQSDIDALFD